jgi:FeS assembly SUF system protein
MEEYKPWPLIGGENNPESEIRHNPKTEEEEIKEIFPRLAAALSNKPTVDLFEKASSEGMNGSEKGELKELIITAIKTVYDPEIPVNIYELGLIYEVNIDDQNKVDVIMTLTSPGCPAAGMLPGDVEEKVRTVEGITEVKVEVTFDPPWDQSMMTDEAKLELGFM